MTKEITQAYLQAILDYNPKTGLFVWKHRTDITPAYIGRWNARYEGEVAGTIKTDNSGYTYWYITINNVRYLAHRVAWFYMKGIWPIEIDHWNGCTLDNCFDNLRETDHSLNQANRRPDRGYELSRNGQKYVVRIQKDGARIPIGTYNTPQEATIAYITAHKEIFGAFSVYNRLEA